MSSVAGNTVDFTNAEARKRIQEKSKAMFEKMEASSKSIQDAFNRMDKVAKKYIEEHDRRVAANGGKKLPNRFETIEARLGVLTFGFDAIKSNSAKSTALVSQLESTVKSFTELVEQCITSRAHDHEELQRKDEEIEMLRGQIRYQEVAIEYLTRRMEELERRFSTPF